MCEVHVVRGLLFPSASLSLFRAVAVLRDLRNETHHRQLCVYRRSHLLQCLNFYPPWDGIINVESAFGLGIELASCEGRQLLLGAVPHSSTVTAS